MEEAAASHPQPSTAEDHSADDSSPSLPPSLSSCLLAVRRGKNTTCPSIFFHLHRIKTVYSPLPGLGIVCPPASQSMDVAPGSLPISCSPSLSMEMLSLQTPHSFHHFLVTWSGPSPNKGDHLLQQRAVASSGSATEWVGGVGGWVYACRFLGLK